MPTYDYLCDACNHGFEEMQSFSEKPLKKCPKCGKKRLRRLLGTGAAILFKGSGFYGTDYRSDSYKQAAQADANVNQAKDSQGTDKGKSSAKAETPASPGKASGENSAKSSKSGT